MRSQAITLFLAAAALPACTDDTSLLTDETGTNPGALVSLHMNSTVGVMLDDIPVGPLRDAAAAAALAQPASVWKDRASRQVRLTYYRLVFRGQYYSSDHSSSSKVRGPLPLPDKAVWHVQLSGTPKRVAANGHDLIQVDYAFDSMLVTDPASPGNVEPALATIGGTWDEPFNLATDPDLLLERTGYACMDEDEYPANSVFEENTWYFYDDSCKAGSSWCHVNQYQPQESCVESIQKHSGIEKTAMHFTRLAYNANTATGYRVGAITNPGGADLSVIQSSMVDEQKIVYKYLSPTSCEVVEGVVTHPGWRRLLTFSAVVQNDGALPVHLGNVTDPADPYTAAHDFEFSACHNHFHFSHYGAFNYGGAPGAKRAFCMEDTNRFHNDEHTPLTAEHQSCLFQGIGAGWGDEYEFGIPGQWVDITDADTTTAHALTFDNNPDGFLCEGTPVDATGHNIDPHDLAHLVFDPSTFKDGDGNVEGIVRCNKPSTWHASNVGSTQVSSPAGGSYVTEACKLGQMGPNRDCGFVAQSTARSCLPGTPVTLTCTNKKAAQSLRICETSAELGIGMPCTYLDAVTNAQVDGSAQVSFTCPVQRDGDAMNPTGGYSIYAASTVPSQGTGSVTCQ